MQDCNGHWLLFRLVYQARIEPWEVPKLLRGLGLRRAWIWALGLFEI